MFAANNMTYQRKRAQEKKATRRAIARAEVWRVYKNYTERFTLG